MAIITKSVMDSSHWYSLDGKPVHTQPTKDGDGQRATTLRDARKMMLLPSVTSIIGILDKPQLTRWKMREVAKAAIAIPGPQGEEPVERFADRAIEAASQQMLEAAQMADWNEVVRYEGACGVLIEQLRQRALAETMTAAERIDKTRIMQQILRNDAQVRLLIEPWVGELDKLLGARIANEMH